MENNENKFHYLTALLLGVVGLLIILIFVSLRSQADDTTRLAETTVTNTAPSVGDITLTGGLYAGGTMDPALGPANVTSDTNSDLTVTFDYTDLNSCMTVDVDGSFFVRLNKSGESCGASQTDYDTCYEEDTTAAGTFACTDDCQDNDDTAATVECVFPITHFAEPGAWDVTVAVVDEGSGTDSATTSFTMATNNAITLHASDTSLNFW